MKQILLLLTLMTSAFAQADIPFTLSCSDEYQCDLPGATRCSPTTLNLSLTALSDSLMQGSVEQFQSSGVTPEYVSVGTPMNATVTENSGKTRIELNDGRNERFSLEIPTVFYSNMVKNYHSPLSQELGEVQLTNKTMSDTTTVKCQVEMPGY